MNEQSLHLLSKWMFWRRDKITITRTVNHTNIHLKFTKYTIQIYESKEYAYKCPVHDILYTNITNFIITAITNKLMLFVSF